MGLSHLVVEEDGRGPTISVRTSLKHLELIPRSRLVGGDDKPPHCAPMCRVGSCRVVSLHVRAGVSGTTV